MSAGIRIAHLPGHCALWPPGLQYVFRECTAYNSPMHPLMVFLWGLGILIGFGVFLVALVAAFRGPSGK